LVKNALDYVEDLRGAPEPYFSGRRVGTIVTGHGWQGTVTALQGLRDIVHGLRGWPTPYGAGINTSDKPFDAEGLCVDDSVERQISMVLDHLANEDDSDEHIASLAETRLVQM
jgi:FMN reductase